MSGTHPKVSVQTESAQQVDADGTENTEQHPSDPGVADGLNEQDPSNVDLSAVLREVEELRQKVAELEDATVEHAKILEESTDGEISDSDFEFESDGRCEPPFSGNPWKKWKLRRNVAKGIVRKVDHMQRRRKRKKNEVEASDGESEDSAALTVPKRTPLISRLHWNEFSILGPIATSNRAVLEVLVGISGVEFPAPKAQLSKITVTNSASLPIFVRPEALPERIRINSNLLLMILGQVHASGFSFEGVCPVVMVRPFKLIFYHRHGIQKQYQHLVDTHMSKSPDKDVPRQNIIGLTSPTPPITDSAMDATLDSQSTAGSDTISPDKVQDKEGTRSSTVFRLPGDALGSKLALEHMRPLIEFLDHYLLPRLSFLESAECKKVTFPDLWLLFEPGGEVIDSDGDQAYRIHKVTTAKHRAVPSWSGIDAWTPAPPPRRGGHESVEISDIVRPSQNQREGDDKPIKLHCVYIDSDGFSIGPVTMVFEIRAFAGEKLVTDLPVYPLRFRTTPLQKDARGVSATARDHIKVREELIERGKKFVQVGLTRHVYYAGPTFDREMVDGQVVLDNYQMFGIDKVKQAPILDRWVDISEPAVESESVACFGLCCRFDIVWSEQDIDKRRENDFLRTLLPPEREGQPSLATLERPVADLNNKRDTTALTDDEYLIMSNRVYGFVLRTRQWAELDLRHVTEVNYRRDRPETTLAPGDKTATHTAFDDLVLPPGHRDVILSLVAQHFRDEEHHEVDIFRGKGKGLILLLHGAPGVGKTSTAEGVAEAFRKPLLQITCGDLGSTAKEVEIALERNFALASRWDCVLLLDEADVFLASRSRAVSGADFNRNALVAVFLRVLEYYTGILFLTTNRIGDFDEAFASRIHVSLEYPPLDRMSTEKILALNIRLIKDRFKKNERTLKIDELNIGFRFLEYWQTYEKARLNGRQIRNACQTALALAEFEAQGGSHEAVLAPNATVSLQSKHFDTVLKAYRDFNKYLKDIYGTSSEEHAGELGLRARDKTPKKVNTGRSPAPDRSPSAGGFPGAHLYHQPHPTQSHLAQSHPPQMYQALPQQQSYLFPVSGQQNFSVPVQDPHASLANYQSTALRSDDTSLPGFDHGTRQSEPDAGAGHDPQYQMQSFGLSHGQPYFQPIPGNPRQ
ncbi:uncharacterized protein EKO05_0009881 [Ascochyta rabiei]|uniref:ATP binding n=1 Tax=Didymella rabiei TaxID=5454 RepID=A0A163M6U1_DIDRA|nr:uncharacterized protein EKO05_0009881 [Ascochyta rabiei]KZM28450.1 ATP binding [Ascochyta rabiei]UPX19623.1 hypothetical protein EKO05_0009881 [Ascochyta rabiei]